MPSRRSRVRTSLLALFLMSSTACGARSPQAPFDAGPVIQVLPSFLLDVGRGPAIPKSAPSSPSASPRSFERIPFAFPPGANAMVCVYDRKLQDVYVYPGTGPGVQNVSELTAGQYCFDDKRSIYLFDTYREEQIKLVDGREVGGYAFAPALAGSRHVYFLGQNKPKLASRFIGLAYTISESAASNHVAPGKQSGSLPEAPGTYLAKPRFLSILNAFAVLHGQITSLNVDIANRTVVFTTGDGGIYLYEVAARRVVPLFPDMVVGGDFFATAANIDPVWGRYVVWQDTRRHGLMVFDRFEGQLDTVPYANLAHHVSEASAPGFHGSDPYDVVFTLTFPSGETRLVCYNILTEDVLNLTVLNAFRSKTDVRIRT